MAYYSLTDEVDTHEFVRKWSREKRILLPVVVGDDLELRVYRLPKGGKHIFVEFINSIKELEA